MTYSDKRALYEVGEEMSGLSFGKRRGALLCRIYDKTRESQDKGHDWWPDVWGSKYDPNQMVLRVEFEFSREGLTNFNVDTPEDAFDMALNMGVRIVQLVVASVPTDDDTRSRWPVHPRWALIQQSSLRGGCAPASRIKEGERQGELRTLRKLTLTLVEDELLLYERISGRTFPDRIREKRQRAMP